MTDRDRLIELIKKGVDISRNVTGLFSWGDVADYLLANGVIVPPCKVGDTVYVITTKRPCYACKLCSDFCHKNCSFDDRNELVIKLARACSIDHSEINKVHLEIDQSKMCHSYEYTCWFEDFGKTVFLTKEEAEQALVTDTNVGSKKELGK